MIIGIGIDIARVERFTRLLSNPGFLERFFPEKELEYIKSRGSSANQSLAGRFAAREAFFKALGTGFKDFSPRDIAILNNDKGKPQIQINSKITNYLEKKSANYTIHLSISHEKEYAIAQVILEDLC